MAGQQDQPVQSETDSPDVSSGLTDKPLVPGFLIGGAPRSGTTFLCEALDSHPGIAVARPFIPEPKVFMTPTAGPSAYRERYREFFGPETANLLRGEKTSYYLENSEACQRIKDTLPDVRIVFILREPVERAYSNWLWSRMQGLETISFEEAIELEGSRVSPLPPERSYARPYDYLTRANYAAFARRYHERFRRDQLAFYLYEAIEDDPDGLLREVQRFLAVEPLARRPTSLINPARQSGPPLDPKLRARLRERMRPRVEALARETGLDVGRWGY